MKARVKETGEIVEVVRLYSTPFGNDIYCDAKENHYPYLLDELDFDFGNDPDYWEKLKHQYAGMAMEGMMAHTNIDYDEIVDLCVEFATALVEKLKESKV